VAPQSSRSRSAAAAMSKEYLDVQIKVEKVKSAKPVKDMNGAKRGSNKPSKLNHLSNCTRLIQKIIIKPFSVQSKIYLNGGPIMKGGVLYFTTLASFEG
jgi:hypothetical protein